MARKTTEADRAYQAAYRAANREKIRANQAAYVARHKEKVYARTAAYEAANQEKRRAYLAIYRKAHSQEKLAEVKRRRARKRGAPLNDFTAAQWREMQAHYAHRCQYCGKRAKGRLSQDHITPLSKGGSHTKSNIIPACRSCNSRKATGPVPVPVQPMLL